MLAVGGDKNGREQWISVVKVKQRIVTWHCLDSTVQSSDKMMVTMKIKTILSIQKNKMTVTATPTVYGALVNVS